jgi:hypothetical protein
LLRAKLSSSSNTVKRGYAAWGMKPHKPPSVSMSERENTNFVSTALRQKEKPEVVVIEIQSLELL